MEISYFHRLICMIIFVIVAPFIGGIIDGVDRKVTARMQGRTGPCILQPFYDIKKLFQKQLVEVNRLQLLMVLSYLSFVIFSGALFFGGCDILLSFFSLTTASMFLILASTSTHSPFSSIGSERELVQMMCYEPMVLLTAVGFYLASDSFMVIDIFKCDKPAIFTAPGFFVGFLFILTIKLRKSPFDLSTSHHAHQEVVRGVTTEMSGINYAAIEIAEWYENVLLFGVVGLFFVTKNPLSYIVALIAVILVFFLEQLIDNANARLKWKFMFEMSWAATLVTGGINLLILELMK